MDGGRRPPASSRVLPAGSSDLRCMVAAFDPDRRRRARRGGLVGQPPPGWIAWSKRCRSRSMTVRPRRPEASTLGGCAPANHTVYTAIPVVRQTRPSSRELTDSAAGGTLMVPRSAPARCAPPPGPACRGPSSNPASTGARRALAPLPRPGAAQRWRSLRGQSHGSKSPRPGPVTGDRADPSWPWSARRRAADCGRQS